MKKILFFLSLLLIAGCVSKKDEKKTEKPLDFDHMVLMAQDLTTKGKYLESINMLNDALQKFPDKDILSINYNIGYNYYKAKKYDDAKSYFNRVINFFEKNRSSDTAELNENRKYTILSGLMLDRIKKDFEAMKDPYHIKEEMQENKTVKPKKK